MPGHHAPSRTRKASATRKANNQKKIAGVFEGGVDHLLHPEPPKTGVAEVVEGRNTTPDSLIPELEVGHIETATPTPTTKGHFPTIDLMAPAPHVEATPPGDIGDLAENNAPSKLSKAERRVMALNLRTAGHSFRVIAEELGVSVKTAYHDVADALTYLSKYERVLAEDHRAMQLARLDAMLSYVWGRVENGDTFAITTALSIMSRQARLLGLDAPIEIDVNIKRPLKEATLSDLMELAGRLANTKRLVPGSVLSTSQGHTIDLPVTVEGAEGKGGIDWEDGPDDDADDDGEDK